MAKWQTAPQVWDQGRHRYPQERFPGNRQRSKRIDFHEIIVLERSGTFQHYFVRGVFCRDIKQIETPGAAAGMGGSNPGLPEQWVIRSEVVQAARNQPKHILSLEKRSAVCSRHYGTAERTRQRYLC